MDGVLNINKPSGMTSHDVVQAVRRLLKEKRVGHTGTLDPLATGVLVLCIGRAPRIARCLEAGNKEYDAVMRLGVTTDTLDAEGRVLETRSYDPPARSQLLQAVNTFTGTIMQQPPAFSAVKVAGIPSYKRARQGNAEPLKPRQVTIHAIELAAYDNPLVNLIVRCSKGVYIRSLCADIGEMLGSGAHMAGLVRTRSGRFTIQKAVTLGTLAEAAAAGSTEQLLVPMDEALADFPEIALHAADADKILHGNSVLLPEPSSQGSMQGLIRVHDHAGRLLGLARTDGTGLRPELVFSQPRD